MAEQPQAAKPAPDRSRSPWPGRIAGGIVILSIIAILLAMYLPRERQEMQPQAGQSYAQNPVNTPQTPYSDPQQWETQQSQQSQQLPAPDQSQPQQQQDTQQQDPSQTNTGWQQQPNPSPGQYPQPNQNPTPSAGDTSAPAPQPTAGQAPAPAPSTGPSPAPAPAPGPTSAPAPSPSSNPAPGPAPQQRPQPGPAPQQRQQPGPLLNQREAMQALGRVEDAERGRALGAIAELRKDMYQDQEFWEIMKTVMAPAIAQAVAGSDQRGYAEIMQLIDRSRTGREAEAALVQRVRRWALPRAVENRLVQVLSTATSYQEACAGLDDALGRAGNPLSDVGVRELKSWAQWGAQRAQQGR